ncbi:Gp15 family bacteriophage protein [Listeria newyorkensis]|uniref:Bacteriophage Gp15 protein n=1 Tax=Listeria newyorkensis TaxID=1497681 RepID=A0A841Z2V6_9LIST|nr:Gp15 family bacteriophage protein [Listeria newyorkensis]MBC1459076.1 hypothetical protein [Listeria newyorkensis]
MLSLTAKKSNPDRILVYNDTKIKIRITFDKVIKSIKLQGDNYFNDSEKIVIMYRMFVVDYRQYEHNPVDIYNIVTLIHKELGGNEEEESEEIFNFFEDADRIITSFMMSYKIDLEEQIGLMSWDRFMTLFNNLPEETPMMQAIMYRTCKVPTGKEHAEERKRILKLKKHYELSSQRKKREQADLERMMKAFI